MAPTANPRVVQKEIQAETQAEIEAKTKPKDTAADVHQQPHTDTHEVKNTAEKSKGDRPENAPFWHPCPPAGLKVTTRFDQIPNVNPLELLFSRLPTPRLDFGAAWSDVAREKIDKNFAFVLWGFANSDRDRVVALSNDPQAGALWDIARDAFTLDDLADLNKVKNYFLQGLAQVSVESGPVDRALVEQQHAANPDASLGRYFWAIWADWVARGRGDGESLGTIREVHTDRNELQVVKAWTCYSCECTIRDGVRFCGFCCHPEFKQMNGIRYCSAECQDWDWDAHRYECSRRRFFFRGCEIFRRIAHDFEVATYTGSHMSVISLVVEAMKLEATCVLNETGDLELPAHLEADVDTGEGATLETSGALHFGRLAWDQPDIYAVLHPLISNIFRGFCDQLSIVKVYVRNARDIMIRRRMKPGVTGTIKEKQPMFHPHSVLYLRIKDGEEFIIDLHSSLYGFATDVVPFNVFIRSRVASIISIEDALDPARENWIPEPMRKIQRNRHEMITAFLARCKSLIQRECKAKNPQSSIFQICNLKDDLYHDMRDKIYALSRKTLDELAHGKLPIVSDRTTSE